MLIACGHVLANDWSDGTWLQRPCHRAVSAVVPGCSRLIEFVNRFRQAQLIRPACESTTRPEPSDSFGGLGSSASEHSLENTYRTRHAQLELASFRDRQGNCHIL